MKRKVGIIDRTYQLYIDFPCLVQFITQMKIQQLGQCQHNRYSILQYKTQNYIDFQLFQKLSSSIFSLRKIVLTAN